MHHQSKKKHSNSIQIKVFAILNCAVAKTQDLWIFTQAGEFSFFFSTGGVERHSTIVSKDELS